MAMMLLAKTTESFKLADLQTLEARLQANHSSGLFDCERILLDKATGSSLLALELLPNDSDNSDNSDNDDAIIESLYDKEGRLPSSLQRCEWISAVQAHHTSDDVEGFLHAIENRSARAPIAAGPWTLDYILMKPSLVSAAKDNHHHQSQQLLEQQLHKESCI